MDGLKKALNKWNAEEGIKILSDLIYRMVILRHRIKMAWFDANCEDKPVKGLTDVNKEDLSED